MKIVCDTNVLISGILFHGHSREILRLSSRGIIQNFISPDILEEVEEVLLRPKFGLPPEQVDGILQLFRDSFNLVEPIQKLSVVEADPDDDRILEVAHEAKAEYIVSGDHHLQDIKKWKSIRIVSPTEFMKKF